MKNKATHLYQHTMAPLLRYVLLLPLLSGMAACSEKEPPPEALKKDSIAMGTLNNPAPVPAGLVTIRFIVTGKYVGAREAAMRTEATRSGVGTWEVYEKVDIDAEYAGLRSLRNGEFLKVDPNNGYYLFANGGTTCDNDWEKFRMEVSGLPSGGVAIKCKGNNKYLNIENVGSFPMRAFASGINTWEEFRVEPVVDMWRAATAFADNFPGKSKLAGYTTMLNWIKYADEKRNGTYVWQFEMFGTDGRYPNNEHPVWNAYGLTWAGDWEVLTGFATQPKYSPADNPAAAWSIPRCVRYCWPQALTSPSITRNRYLLNLGACTKSGTGTASEYGISSAPYMLNLSNSSSQENMGTRWVINLHYRNTAEYFIYDLGPAAGTFNPRYGIVGYSNGQQVGGQPLVVHYTNIQPQPAHDDIYCTSGVGD